MDVSKLISDIMTPLAVGSNPSNPTARGINLARLDAATEAAISDYAASEGADRRLVVILESFRQRLLAAGI